MTTPAYARDAETTPGSASQWSGEASTGISYQQGDFGTEDKFETLSIPFSVSVKKGRFHLAASLPYMRTTAPIGVIVSQGGLFGTPLLGTDTVSRERTAREGIGDLTLQAAVDLPVAGFATSLASSIKVPTASSAKGLGTGKVDYAVSGQVARPMGAIVPFASLSYTVLGEPDGFDVRNTLGGAAGARLNLGDRSFAALSYSYEQAATGTLPDRQAVGLGVGTGFNDNIRLSVEGAAGLSEGAPAASVAARIGFGFR
ncbi:transporter [Novosphingobium pentaromativorans]|nr:hypothetical protein [Novosphingobium pentaromativorans]